MLEIVRCRGHNDGTVEPLPYLLIPHSEEMDTTEPLVATSRAFRDTGRNRRSAKREAWRGKTKHHNKE